MKYKSTLHGHLVGNIQVLHVTLLLCPFVVTTSLQKKKENLKTKQKKKNLDCNKNKKHLCEQKNCNQREADLGSNCALGKKKQGL